MFSCTEKPPSIRLLYSRTIAFPSASAIEYLAGRLYVFGDDAPYLLVLSTDYRAIDSITYWQEAVARISKGEKPDIESAMIFERGGLQIIAGLGSLSAANRHIVYEFFPRSGLILPAVYFPRSFSFSGIEAVNIEGSCAVNRTMVLANRANLGNPKNHLLFCDSGEAVVAKQFTLPKTKIIAGVSGLYYLKEKDLLLFTASEEATTGTIADGAIGESYLGGIRNFTGKMSGKEFRPDFFLKLSDFDKKFRQQKIESVCVEKVDEKGMLLHLVADNDDGSSGLFTVSLSLF